MDVTKKCMVKPVTFYKLIFPKIVKNELQHLVIMICFRFLYHSQDVTAV